MNSCVVGTWIEAKVVVKFGFQSLPREEISLAIRYPCRAKARPLHSIHPHAHILIYLVREYGSGLVFVPGVDERA